ncbi:MAG: MotA/TolQ/ExbB proton channel family protein [Phycisphaerae bacterium]
MTSVLRSLALCFVIVPAATALAQVVTATPPETRSMWQVVRDGIQWPAYLILAGSLVTIALIVEHFIVVRPVTTAPTEQVRKAKYLIERRNFRECLERMRKSSTFFARVMTASLEHARHGFDAMHDAALEKSGELSGQMFRKVEYMNIFGNLGPLMGLLGTVYGMIIAFGALGQGGGVAGTDAGGLAIGIALALVNTLLGLGLAIVGLGFFGVCRNRVDAFTTQATVQVLDLLEYFRPVPAVPHGVEPARPAAAGSSARAAAPSSSPPPTPAMPPRTTGS